MTAAIAATTITATVTSHTTTPLHHHHTIPRVQPHPYSSMTTTTPPHLQLNTTTTTPYHSYGTITRPPPSPPKQLSPVFRDTTWKLGRPDTCTLWKMASPSSNHLEDPHSKGHLIREAPSSHVSFQFTWTNWGISSACPRLTTK